MFLHAAISLGALLAIVLLAVAVDAIFRSRMNRPKLVAIETPPTKVDANGTKIWLKNGVPHREDGPAIEYLYGSKHWYINGVRHRDNGPAIIDYDGSRQYYQHGLLHREDGPAVELPGGHKEYFLNGQLQA